MLEKGLSSGRRCSGRRCSGRRYSGRHYSGRRDSKSVVVECRRGATCWRPAGGRPGVGGGFCKRVAHGEQREESEEGLWAR